MFTEGRQFGADMEGAELQRLIKKCKAIVKKNLSLEQK
jgi:hypothetical protein